MNLQCRFASFCTAGAASHIQGAPHQTASEQLPSTLDHFGASNSQAQASLLILQILSQITSTDTPSAQLRRYSLFPKPGASRPSESLPGDRPPPLAPANACPRDLWGPDSPPAGGIFVLSAQTHGHRRLKQPSLAPSQRSRFCAWGHSGGQRSGSGSLRAGAGAPSPPYRTSRRGVRLPGGRRRRVAGS